MQKGEFAGDNPIASAIDKLATTIETGDADDLSSYSDAPDLFIEEVLGDRMWDKLIEIAYSVRDNPYTVVKSANGVGKTWLAGRLVIWWINVFKDNCKVITTAAPPERQIKELLWGEIRDTWRKAKDKGVNLVGKPPGVMSLRVSDNWWAQGFTIPSTGTREERIARFQGHHAQHLLCVLDEAHGIPPEIFEAVDSCLAGGHNHLLLLSNPLAPFGAFYDSFSDPKFNCITLEAFDHPNVKTGQNLFPGCVTREKTEDRIRKWSRPMYKDEEEDASCFKVPDNFATDIASQTRKVTMPMLDVKTLGRFPSQSERSLINRTWIDAAMQRWEPMPPLEIPGIAGADIADMGVDFNAYLVRRDWWVSQLLRWNGIDPFKTGTKLTELCKGDWIEDAMVDALGVGAGVPAHMRANGIKGAKEVKVSEKPTRKSKDGEFLLLRDQLMWEVREWLRTNPKAALPPDKELKQELYVLTYDIDTRTGKITTISREDIIDLIGRSPDALSALMMTFYKEKLWAETGWMQV